MNNKFIAIEGVIGVGKTTLVRLLKPHFNAQILLEVFEENPFLADFYAERERYAFQTQLFFLLSRYQQQNESVQTALTQGNLISDYTFAKDELFAWLNLKDDELAMYGRVHSALSEQMTQPNLLVYLQADHDVVMQRIAQRDRPYERDMDPEYIRRLSSAYDAWLANLTDIPVLTIDATKLDFLSKGEDLQYVIDQIKAALSESYATPASSVQNSSHRLLPASGSLANYQEFHRHLDQVKEFDQDLFLNYIALSEEMGELADSLKRFWMQRKMMEKSGQPAEVAHQETVLMFRKQVGNELADIMAYILKLSNYMGIDLEQAYVSKMSRNLDREWTFEP